MVVNSILCACKGAVGDAEEKFFVTACILKHSSASHGLAHQADGGMLPVTGAQKPNPVGKITALEQTVGGIAPLALTVGAQIDGQYVVVEIVKEIDKGQSEPVVGGKPVYKEHDLFREVVAGKQPARKFQTVVTDYRHFFLPAEELTPRPTESEAVLANPQTNEEVVGGSIQGVLSDNIGYYVVIQFLIGTNTLVAREGVLYAVGINYVTLYDPLADNYTVCDMYSIKFVTFYDSRTRPASLNNVPNLNTFPS